MTTELTVLSRVSYRDREINGPRLRGLLALLAGELHAGCSISRLVSGLWPQEQPENPTKALQILVSRVRSQCGAELIVTTSTGYRLALSADQVDAAAIQLHAATAAQHLRSAEYAAALEAAEAGRALWPGIEPDPDSEDPVDDLCARRESAYWSLLRSRAVALSRLHRPAEAIGTLIPLCSRAPRDEELLLELLRCEAATEGAAAALTRYEGYRRDLRDELGTDPGAALRTEHRRLLAGEQRTPRTGVPHEPNQLLGRAADVIAVGELLRGGRVTSIIGPGGLGKTRLAYAVSRQAGRPVFVVELAGARLDTEVVGAVAAALGVGAAGPLGYPDELSGIQSVLGAEPALLVLDNCEQVIDGAATMVSTLIAAGAELRVLTTSRAPLGLSSESVYLLPELDRPAMVELFTQRARAARPGAALLADQVGALCARLDGLPLAAELAAARVRTMSVAEIADGLSDRFALLRGGLRDAPQRHHTLHAVVGWSWNLLAEPERAAMRSLAMFVDGFTADTAHCMLDRPDTRELLEHLTDQSLLKPVETASGIRLRMLETVREFSLAAQTEAGECAAAAATLRDWAQRFCLQLHDPVFGPRPRAALDLVRAEQENLGYAFELALEAGDGATLAALGAVLGGFYAFESNHMRMMTLAQDLGWQLSHYCPAPELVEVTRTALSLNLLIAFAMGPQWLPRILVTLRRLPPAPPGSTAGAWAAALEAAPYPDKIMRLCDDPDPLIAAAANGVISYLLENSHGPAAAFPHVQRMHAVFATHEMPWVRLYANGRMSEVSLALGRGQEAYEYVEASYREVAVMGTGNSSQLALGLVLASLMIGDVDQAERTLLASAAPHSEEWVVVRSFDQGVRAEIELARGRVDSGLAMWRRAVATLGAPQEHGTMAPWVYETRAVAIVAHAQHDRLADIGSLVAELPGDLLGMLSRKPYVSPAVHYYPIVGELVLAQALVCLRRGDTRLGARMVALAEQLHYPRYMQPTMSSARVRSIADDADGPEYRAAMSEYSGRSRAELRAVTTELATRAQRQRADTTQLS
ncbi:AfsR/SARP family transcriptional regulator [Pseudonocardiaceae bacterium YIM PH 21723]|nr:AfsR/SARP family transcriptional regulator [Pseudonocardiaceae bacterium YIM PH 21723]